MKAEPHTSPDGAILALAMAHASLRSRIAHLMLLLVGIGGATALASLLLTEAALPGRTRAALAGLLVLNVVWTAYAGWVLSARRTLLSNHRVIAGWIALAAAAAFALGSLTYGLYADAPAGYVAAGLGVLLVVIASLLLIRARRDWRMLRERRSAIEAALQGTDR